MEPIALSIEPIGDRIAVREFRPDEKSRGGIVIPERARQGKRIGVVVSVGPGVVNRSFRPDQILAWNTHAGMTIEWLDDKLTIIDEEDVVVRLHEATPIVESEDANEDTSK